MHSSPRLLALAPLLGLLGAAPACDALTGGEGGSGAADPGWNEPVVLVDGLNGPTALAQNQSELVWADEQGLLQTITKAGAERVTLGESGGAIADLVVDGSQAFWLDSERGRLWSVDLAAGQPTLLAIALDHPHGIGLDAAFVYWLDGSGAVMQLPRYGGTAWTLATGSSQLGDLVLDAERLYFTDTLAGTVSAAWLDGSPVETLATGQNQPGSIARDSTALYWATASALVALDRTEPDALPVTLSAGLARPDWLCAAGGYLYWSSAETGTVGRAPKEGGDGAPVATGQQAPAALVVDTRAVYWLNHGDGPGTGTLVLATRRE
jgi:sugar lactone lactonase YvrE